MPFEAWRSPKLNEVLQERTFSEVKRLCCAGLDGPELLVRVVECLRSAVPFEAYCASTTDPATGLITHALAEEMGGEREAAFFLDHLYFEHDFDQHVKMVRDRRAAALASELAGGDLDRCPRYRGMLRPLGLASEMRTVFASGDSLWGAVDLSREAGRPDFTSQDTALLKRLAPHLVTGLKTAGLRSRASVDEPNISGTGPDIPGVLTLDHRGRVIRHTPAAERWLEEIGGLMPGWRETSGLPAAVRMVAGVLRRSLSPASDGDLNSVPHLNVRARSGRLLTLYGSLTEQTDGLPSETVIVIELAKPEDLVFFNLALYGLSPREGEIARLVARGASTRQISADLYISEYTVQNHLRSAFEKVGVRSRRELLKRIFFDNL